MGGEADAGARQDEGQAGPSAPDGSAAAPPARQASAPASASGAHAARGHVPVPRRSPFADGDAVRPHAQRRWHVASERRIHCVALFAAPAALCASPCFQAIFSCASAGMCLMLGMGASGPACRIGARPR